MHTVELYETTKRFAESIGYQVREENLGGIGGGACEVAGRKCLFIDVSMSSVDRLEQLVSAVGRDPLIYTVDVPDGIEHLFSMRRAA